MRHMAMKCAPCLNFAIFLSIRIVLDIRIEPRSYTVVMKRRKYRLMQRPKPGEDVLLSELVRLVLSIGSWVAILMRIWTGCLWTLSLAPLS